MPDYERMLEDLARASKAVKLAIEHLAPMKKMTQIEAYVLGHLRATEAVLEKAEEAVQKTHSLKDPKLQGKEEG